MRFLSAAILSCLAAGAVYGQRGPTPFYEDTNNVPVSPEVHADRTVTFRLFAPKASEVLLMGFPGILEVIKHVWNQSGGGHSWPNWQMYLSKYAPLLFRD